QQVCRQRHEYGRSHGNPNRGQWPKQRQRKSKQKPSQHYHKDLCSVRRPSQPIAAQQVEGLGCLRIHRRHEVASLRVRRSQLILSLAAETNLHIAADENNFVSKESCRTKLV